VRARRLRALLAASASALALAACTASVVDGHGRAHAQRGSTSPAVTDPRQPRAAFFDCSDSINTGALGASPARLAKLSFSCASISVPLDYSHPEGRHIQLVLVRIHDSDNHAHTGSLIMNPGGPGGSGIELALGVVGQLSERILTHFDLIGFDPRGVGQSSPVHCLSDSQKDRMLAASPDILTAAGFAQAKSIARELATGCERDYGSALADIDTVAAARDMDQIRQAVGDPRINYLGFSYGTELGAQYIHQFPRRIRVAVLDGAVDPLYDPITATQKQLQGFEDAFGQFAAWCAQHSPCSSLGDPERAVRALEARAAKSPIPSSAPGETRKATPNLVLTAVSQAMYSQPQWPTLAAALRAAQSGDAKGLLALADQYNERFGGHYTNILDAFNTVSCNDSPPGPSDATIRAKAQEWNRRYPLFGLNFASGLFFCQQWQPHRTEPPKPTAPDAAHTVLVIGNLHDPATPYQGALDLARTLGNAQVLTWNGEGHTSYLHGSSCIDQHVDTYLVTGRLPPRGLTCPR
jgi:pimeloyl-ACP methyl ester carboxylesterase